MPHQSSRPTIRAIAKESGLSPTTVSLALRNSVEISAPVKERVRAVAHRMGYRPDPVLTQLMEHLRANSRIEVQASLGLLCSSELPFVRRLVVGAAVCASKLGYSLDRIELRKYVGKPEALTNVLLARGVKGLLLAPALEPTDYGAIVDWSKFAAVAMTYSIYAPQLHRVVSHHFENASRTFALLVEKGFRRIGLAMTEDLEYRANRSYSGAYCRLGPMMGHATLPILLLDPKDPDLTRAWFETHKPDAVVSAHSGYLRDLYLPYIDRQRLEQTAFACLDCEAGDGVAGMNQLFEIVGEHAVEVLVSQLKRNERGLPVHPKVTMVEGAWHEASGLFPLRCRTSAAGWVVFSR